MKPDAKAYNELLDSLEPQIAAAFVEAVRLRVSRADLADVESGVLLQDVDAILKAAGLTGVDLQNTMESIRAAVFQGAALEYGLMGQAFDIGTPAAQAWLKNKSSTLVTELLDGQREAIRNTLQAGMGLGRNPRSVALDIVGRVGKSQVRQGGIIGLHEQYAQFVDTARFELLALDKNYLTRARRDRRFDSLVRKAINSDTPLTERQVDTLVSQYADSLLQLRGENIARTEAMEAVNAGRAEAWAQATAASCLVAYALARGKAFTDVRKAINSDTPLTDRQVDTLVSQYADSLLQLRGENIARTEAMEAVNAGRAEAWAQAVEDGALKTSQAVKVWESASDRRTRDTHRAMEGQRVGLDAAFETGDGEKMLFPGDTSLGATAHNTINCRCFVRVEVDFIGLAANG